MRIVSGSLHHLEIPFRGSFEHNLNKTSRSGSVLLRLESDGGHVGFGECVPRPYVTGESADSCMEHLADTFLPTLFESDLDKALSARPGELPSVLDGFLPRPGAAGFVALNAAAACAELALWDCVLRARGESLGVALPPSRRGLVYSGVITGGSLEDVTRAAERAARLGITLVKVKVGLGDDSRRVAEVRRVLGGDVSLRVDANAAFDRAAALAFLSSVEKFRLDGVEQPLPRADSEGLAWLRARSPVRVIADESVVTMEDAVGLAGLGACDILNLRISKNGGIKRTLELAEFARRSGMGVQIGCQVGETSVLSAAGRHVAAHLERVEFLEGSFGRMLLSEDICAEPVEFGPGGRAGLLTGPGLGVEVDEAAVAKYSRRTVVARRGRN